MAKEDLRPTIWRTCRVLANPLRLKMLGCIIRKPDQTVEELALVTDMTFGTASHYLRMLQARGLVSVERVSRWVRYAPQPNEGICWAPALMRALCRYLKSADGDEALEDAEWILTGFTHPRRLLIIKTLSTGPKTAGQLRTATGISRPAMTRHLSKLLRRDLVQYCDNGTYKLVNRRDPLARVLIEITTAD